MKRLNEKRLAASLISAIVTPALLFTLAALFASDWLLMPVAWPVKIWRRVFPQSGGFHFIPSTEVLVPSLLTILIFYFLLTYLILSLSRGFGAAAQIDGQRWLWTNKVFP
ncbi:MAG TPA: hypothetical protein VFX96_08600 [Pyrinomonadaceae bacterium]|nr:hypothetical protein [Pyrinomonadaceae bacterium]